MDGQRDHRLELVEFTMNRSRHQEAQCRSFQGTPISDTRETDRYTRLPNRHLADLGVFPSIA